ncbi:GIY-YIG nuclease superfamily, partial [Trinorchestia longiramus]
NNQSAKLSELKQTNVVYEYKCSHEDCEPHNRLYIGVTTTTLSRRLTMHLGSGGPKNHEMEEHNETLTREKLVKNTEILRHEPEYNRLQILEALLIHQKKPSINNQ